MRLNLGPCHRLIPWLSWTWASMVTRGLRWGTSQWRSLSATIPISDEHLNLGEYCDETTGQATPCSHTYTATVPSKLPPGYHGSLTEAKLPRFMPNQPPRFCPTSQQAAPPLYPVAS